MKTARRQELRKNDLSSQIEQIGDYIKKNATTLTITIVGAAVVVGGGLWYYNQRTTRAMDAWAQLALPEADEGASLLIDRYEELAQEAINPALTRAAWLKVGETALAELNNPTPDADAADADSETDRSALILTAKEAFTHVLELAGDDTTARGRAMIALGILEENAGRFEEARGWYEKIKKDERLAGLPFQSEADYRLAGLTTAWAQVAPFPPPPPMVLLDQNNPAIQPTPVSPGAVQTTPIQAKRIEGFPQESAPLAPSAPPPARSPSGETATPPATPAPRIPTTQPAGDTAGATGP
ncbi:MAG: hypothetical protein ACE5E1_05720 [Phycisphaerae bacterium]